ncbi:MAG: glycosyltransferase [bacterium]|nr:glycosyltransferase [bacterium]
MRLSVVVPTFERHEKLEACIASLASQEDATAIGDVVIADDGSQDDTIVWLDAASRRDWPFALRIVRLRHRGPAATRNAGVRAATSEYVAFTGDDCVLAPGWAKAHLLEHATHPGRSVLGHTTWLPSLDVTPFMHYQENGGSQFAYGRIANRDDAGWRFYYTTNISTPRHLLLAHPFEESFPAARYEDMELGWRLERAGHRIAYRPEALAWHDHPVAFESFRARSPEYGEYAALFHRLHPQDEELARALGIRDAEACDRVFLPGIQAAEQVVEDLEDTLVAKTSAPAAFGVRGATELLHDAYRLLIHQALVGGIRKGLSLPESEQIAIR